MLRKTSSARFAVVVLLALSALLPVSALAGPEEAAIVAGTKKYLAAQSYSAEMNIKVEKVSGDYARVGVEPNKKDMDGATVFLKREHGAWVGLTIGTGWDPADLDKLHIPKSLRP
jgi:outer membrane lipoprotein-sorting protein